MQNKITQSVVFANSNLVTAVRNSVPQFVVFFRHTVDIVEAS